MLRRDTSSRISNDLGAYTTLVILSLVWGSTFLLTDIALDAFSPVQITILRFTIGALAISPLLMTSGQWRPLKRIDWAWFASLGLFGHALPFWVIAWAQQFVPSSLAAIFLSTVPLFVLILARTVLKERVSIGKWIGFSIGFAGLVILIGPSALSGVGEHLLAQLGLLAACFLFACSSMILRRMPATPPIQTTTLALSISVLFLAPLGFIGAAQAVADLTASAGWTVRLLPLGSVLILGIVLSGIGQSVRAFTIVRRGPVFFSTIGYLIPVWASFLGIVFLGETLTAAQVTAYGVILVGLIIAQASPAAKKE